MCHASPAKTALTLSVVKMSLVFFQIHAAVYTKHVEGRVTWYSFSANKMDIKFDAMEMLLDHYKVLSAAAYSLFAPFSWISIPLPSVNFFPVSSFLIVFYLRLRMFRKYCPEYNYPIGSL